VRWCGRGEVVRPPPIPNDRHLAGRQYLADEISFADLMLYPNYALRTPLLEAAGGMENLRRWGERMAARPGVQQGMNV